MTKLSLLIMFAACSALVAGDINYGTEPVRGDDCTAAGAGAHAPSSRPGCHRYHSCELSGSDLEWRYRYCGIGGVYNPDVVQGRPCEACVFCDDCSAEEEGELMYRPGHCSSYLECENTNTDYGYKWLPKYCDEGEVWNQPAQKCTRGSQCLSNGFDQLDQIGYGNDKFNKGRGKSGKP